MFCIAVEEFVVWVSVFVGDFRVDFTAGVCIKTKLNLTQIFRMEKSLNYHLELFQWAINAFVWSDADRVCHCLSGITSTFYPKTNYGFPKQNASSCFCDGRVNCASRRTKEKNPRYVSTIGAEEVVFGLLLILFT